MATERKAKGLRMLWHLTTGLVDSEETEEQLLLCPGIVYLLKPRASGDIVVTTTKRGGLGEALLMSMHDVLLSKSMLAHHLLEAYIQALDRI